VPGFDVRLGLNSHINLMTRMMKLITLSQGGRKKDKCVEKENDWRERKRDRERESSRRRWHARRERRNGLSIGIGVVQGQNEEREKE